MRNIFCSILILVCLSLSAHAGEKCVFDHILMTLPLRDYLELRNFLSLESTREIAGIRWVRDPSNEKGFAKFDDDSYLEVWDETKVTRWGYQEACRMIEKSTLEQIGKEFKSQLGEFKTLAVVGRTGWGGDPLGGMFFIWQPKHIIDPKKDGIRQLLKLVQGNEKGEVNSGLVADYERAGLNLKFQDGKKKLLATDSVGVRRVAVANKKIIGNGLVALQFQRKGIDKDKIVIQTDEAGKPTMYLELTPKVGILVFRADQYKQYFDLFK